MHETLKDRTKILLSGGSGTVGSNIPYGKKISSKDCDLRNYAAVNELFSKNNFNGIINCSAVVGGISKHLDPRFHYELFYDNCAIGLNLLDCARKYKVKRVLSFLSSCIYSDDCKSPYTEDMIYDGPPSPVHFSYAYSKRVLAVQSRIIYEEGDIISNCLIPTNIYGKNDSFGEGSHFIAALIKRAYDCTQTGEDFTVWGDGKSVRDVVHTSDMVNITTWIYDNYFDKDPIIVSSNTPQEVGYISELIAKEFNISPNKIVFDISKPMGQKKRILSGDKLASLTDYKFLSIEEGIKKSVRWFLDNYPNVRL